jgi:tRNA-uridine 2-sulfurtransferase
VLADKPDSQEICFVPGGDYKKFIDAYLDEQGEELPDTAGELVTTSGEVIGKHSGIHNFTVGQRKGLGVAKGNPLYVLEIRGDKRQVVVGSNDELLSKTMRVKDLNWISIPSLDAPMRVKVKIRHRHDPAWATIEMDISVSGLNQLIATFDEPQRAVTPGQAAVFYDGDEVVGGGWIS